MEEEEGVEAKLEGVSERLRDGCGRGSGVGGNELRSVAGGRGSRGEDGDERVSDGFQEGCVASLERPGGKQEVAGSRRWPGRVAARAGRVPVLLAEEEGDRGGRRRWAGPAGGAGQLGRLQVSGPGGLLSFIFVLFYFFSISAICF